MSGFTERDKDVMLASCRGVFAALTTKDHLGDAARGYRYESRTLKGDSFETAFEWARQQKKDAAAVHGCTGVTARYCPVCGTCSCVGSDLDSPHCALHGRESRHAK